MAGGSATLLQSMAISGTYSGRTKIGDYKKKTYGRAICVGIHQIGP